MNTQLPKFERDIAKTIRSRLVEKPNFIQVVLGPRQVGKTTAVKQVLKDLEMSGFKSRYGAADLPAPPETSWIAKEWREARRIADDGSPTVLVLDEVQKIYRWSEEVKRLWDEEKTNGRNLRVVILGSSSLLVQKGLTCWR